MDDVQRATQSRAGRAWRVLRASVQVVVVEAVGGVAAQHLLAGVAALTAGPAVLVFSDRLRLLLLAIAVVLLLASVVLAVVRGHRGRRRRRRLDRRAITEAFSHEVSRRPLTLDRLERALERALWRLDAPPFDLGVIETGDDGFRVLIGCANDVAGPRLLGRPFAWGGAHTLTAELDPGPPAIALVAVSGHPIASGHEAVLAELANILRPLVAHLDREVAGDAL